MVLDGALADPQVRSDILAWMARDNQFHDLPLSSRQIAHAIAHLDVIDNKCWHPAQNRTQDFNWASITLYHRIAPSLLASAAITLRRMNNASKGNSFPNAFDIHLSQWTLF
jgi:hypothetical protein